MPGDFHSGSAVKDPVDGQGVSAACWLIHLIGVAVAVVLDVVGIPYNAAAAVVAAKDVAPGKEMEVRFVWTKRELKVHVRVSSGMVPSPWMSLKNGQQSIGLHFGLRWGQ